MVKDLSYTTINSVNSLHFMTLDPTKDKLKEYEELWNKIRGFVRLITTNSNN